MVNEKGREVAKAGDPYVDKKGKACQEKFYLIMKECSVNEYRHQYESGRNELGSLIEKEAYECYNEIPSTKPKQGKNSPLSTSRPSLIEMAVDQVFKLLLMRSMSPGKRRWYHFLKIMRQVVLMML